MLKIFPRHTVNLSKEIFSAVIRVIKERQIFEGPYVKEFENKFASYNGVKYACGVSSGRAGLYLAIKALHFGRDDEIIMPAYNFYEVPIVIKTCGLKPVFVDVHPQTFNIDVLQVEKNISKRTKAILVTHSFGHPCEMDSITELAKTYNLKVIEDCAHACGTEYRGQKVGTFGKVGVFSFAMGKNMPCFGGGAVITNDATLWARISEMAQKYLYPQKKYILKTSLLHLIAYFSTHPRVFPFTTYPILRMLDLFNISLTSNTEKGIKFSDKLLLRYQKRMINLQAAVGLKQLERIDIVNKRLRENGLTYNALLKHIKKIKIPMEISGANHIYSYYNVVVENREIFRKILLKRGVDTERNHLSDYFTLEFPGSEYSCPVSKKLVSHTLELPNNVYLTEDDIIYIVDCVREASKFI